MKTSLLSLVLLALEACAAAAPTTPPAGPQGQTPVGESPLTTAAPTAATKADEPKAIASSDPVPPPPAATSNGTLKASSAMPMEGKLQAETLLDQVNSQVGNLARCVPLIRKTDKVVGSLNLQVKIAADGSVKPDLQSPTNKEAEDCLLNGVRAWKLAGQGAGRAMVLLMIKD